MTTKTKTSQPDLGLSPTQQAGVVQVLSAALADAHVLYIKLRKFHWNVRGAQFLTLHELFERQYNELADAIDEIAELIVQYGAPAPGTLDEFKQAARLSEAPGKLPSAHDMVAEIVADHEAMVRQLREDAEAVGEELKDLAGQDFLIGLLQKHQKQAWLARAMLDGQSV
jgi:starvation-inducible DNA-binding protein